MLLKALIVLALFPSLLQAEVSQFKSIPKGIELSLGDEDIRLQVASRHAFVLREGPKESFAAARSIFLAPVETGEPSFIRVHNHSVVGLKSNFGELWFDLKIHKWALCDAHGQPLTDWNSLPGKGRTDKDLTFVLKAGNRAGDVFANYGSGNDPVRGSLVQTSAPSRAGNGSTSLPQYWSTAGYGMLAVTEDDNRPARWKSNPTGEITWTIPGNKVDLYLAPASDLYLWLTVQAELTGFAPIPPLWSLGYLQSRWGWKNSDYLEQTLERFYHDNLPVDAFILDFEWYTTTPDYEVPAAGKADFHDFDWNGALLPHPSEQIHDFLNQGLHIVGIRKPRLGNSESLAKARVRGWILPTNPDDPNNANIKTRNLDFSNPAVQSFWQMNNKKFVEAGMSGFWNDEGETSYTEYSYWNQMEEELFKQVTPNARFWSLNRSFTPGLQRFGAAAWTGDIDSTWAVLARTPGELLSYSLSGMPYSTCDIGGFNGDPSPELMVRWMQAGVFFPIDRSHSEIDRTPRFPWLYGLEAEQAMQAALQLRYQLLPYYYSLAYENHRTGAPLMRPLLMEFPRDEKVVNLTDEWLMGTGLLAAPMLKSGGTRQVYLPCGRWYKFETNQFTEGPCSLSITGTLAEIPIYARAGTILPLGPVLQNTDQSSNSPLQLQVYSGKDGAFTLYQDDGKTLAYEKGATRIAAFSWSDTAKKLSWRSIGNYNGIHRFHDIKVEVFSSNSVSAKQVPFSDKGEIVFQ